MPDRRPDDDAPAVGALHLLGVMHGERRRVPLWESAPIGLAEGELVRYRDLAALVYPAAPLGEEVPKEQVLEHHRRLDAVLRRATIVPAPVGIAFRDEREVARFVRGCYTELGDALVLLEGRWEFRLRLAPVGSEVAEVLALDLATRIYSDLRRIAHAARPFPRLASDALTAAFLVDRVETRRFLDRVETLRETHPELVPGVTGPWPAYDFVNIHA